MSFISILTKIFLVFTFFFVWVTLGQSTMVQNNCRGRCCVDQKSLFVYMDNKVINDEDGIKTCFGCRHRTTVFFSPNCNTTSITGNCKFSWYFLTRSFQSQTFKCNQLGGEGTWSCPVIQKGQKYHLDFWTEISDLTWGEVNGQYLCQIQDDSERVIATMEFPCKVTSKKEYFS